MSAVEWSKLACLRVSCGFSLFLELSRCVISMRAVWFKRPVLTLGGIGLVFCLAMFLKSGYEQTVVTDKELDTPRMVRSFSDLEANISNICELRQWLTFLKKSSYGCMQVALVSSLGSIILHYKWRWENDEKIRFFFNLLHSDIVRKVSGRIKCFLNVHWTTSQG